MGNPGHRQYLETQVLTASRERLVLMLYDGLLRFCREAKAAWEQNDLESAHNALLRAQNIVLELTYALDREHGGEFAQRLAQLYGYCYTRLVRANIDRNPLLVDEVAGLLGDLREAWAEALAAKDAPSEDAEKSAPAEPAEPRADEARPRVSFQG